MSADVDSRRASSEQRQDRFAVQIRILSDPEQRFCVLVAGRWRDIGHAVQPIGDVLYPTPRRELGKLDRRNSRLRSFLVVT